MKPAQRALGIGVDHIETVGGVRAHPQAPVNLARMTLLLFASQRHRYVKRMESHLDRISNVKSSLSLEAPVAAFGNGKYRTPHAAKKTGKALVQQQDAFKEVNEAFRRVRNVEGSKPNVATRMAPENQIADKLSRNRKLGSKQAYHDEQHAAELYHLRRRMQGLSSLTERKKNKLDPELYPVVRMRNVRNPTPGEILDYEASRRAGLPQRPQSARATTTASASSLQGEAAQEARPMSARAVSTSARGSAGSTGNLQRSATAPKSTSAGSARAAAATEGDVSLGKPTADVNVLRRRLLEKIVDQRLFKESELRPFLAAVVRQNKQFDVAFLKEAVRDVEREFYLI